MLEYIADIARYALKTGIENITGFKPVVFPDSLKILQGLSLL
jgi:hypothetical protein